MKKLIDELSEIHAELQGFADARNASNVSGPLAALQDSAEKIGESWSGSWLGYHAYVYYDKFLPPPAGAHFSSEWGFIDAISMGTYGNWTEYRPDDVIQEIQRRAGQPDLTAAKEAATRGRKLFERARGQLISILEVVSSKRTDGFVNQLLEEVKKAYLPTSDDFLKALAPSGQLATRDSLALSQGIRRPPHLVILSEVVALRAPYEACERLASIAQKGASHLERVLGQDRRSARVGTNVFIGHGRSAVWRDLKDFVQERLHLPWDEFNRVPVAGITNIARLSEMLDAAAIAFVIMTAEDEQADGQLRARMNVIHEVGLFQGRLGFTKAIVLLEEGCEQFSNIEGLGQIRFPKGNISAAFEEIRRVLEREGLISSGS